MFQSHYNNVQISALHLSRLLTAVRYRTVQIISSPITGAMRFRTAWFLLLSDDRYTFPVGLGSVLSSWDVHRIHMVCCRRLLDGDASD